MTFAQSVHAIFCRLRPFVLLFLAAQVLIRLGLTVVSIGNLSLDPLDWMVPFLTGFWFDIITLLPILAVFLVFPLLLPASWAGKRFDRAVGLLVFALFLFLTVMQGVGEYFFWDEFTTRFNFIAVDYLVYTQEVIQNIMESYPVVPLLAGIGLLAISGTFLLRRQVTAGFAPHPPFMNRLAVFAATTGAAVASVLLTPDSITRPMPSAVARELGGNGLYGLVSAFFSNEIDFANFYRTLPEKQAAERARDLLAENHEPFESANLNDVTRDIRAKGPMLRKNVILVGMESMSAEFLGAFGNPKRLTPNLDRLASEGLLFTEMRATGTRTVRGLEAIALSVPPTPGQSILRRPGSDNLFTIGSVFQDSGYDTRFIYGGYGYFDNMNAFFSGNGFGIVDRGTMNAANVHFANAWGVSDEVLYDEVIRQADASVTEGKNFFSFVMTTSNHRPFTYPDGAIDIPSPGGRDGAVKYSDYAIGELVNKAAARPWFKDTVFVFVADHTASVAGKIELDMNKYHIPCIIWSPGFVDPRRIDRLASQVDIAPSLLAMLHASYRSRFFGDDLINADEAERPVYISNYEKVAMILHGRTTILEPKKQIVQLKGDEVVRQDAIDEEAVDDTVAIYQYASHWRDISRRIPSALDSVTPAFDRRPVGQPAKPEATRAAVQDHAHHTAALTKPERQHILGMPGLSR
ncbi:LTA synthase family protein [Mesorhizobium sp.]|uniref:LTA synthase family protein n=1 Tax=Mesorhizobium sp. TaxID=1871066 RepID=UPI001215117F|nr:LTA synthase family protein [Mesorhizobium sp.]TIP10480.1 MAG: LTA synthase family protein [Mesorhizobium sp.]